MLPPTLFSSGLVLALLLVCPVGAQAGGGVDESGGHLTALLDDQPIDPASVAKYRCHDLEAPVIRCFMTAAERDAAVIGTKATDLGAGTLSGSWASGILGAPSITYVIRYEHQDYLGSSYLISSPISNLATLGWSNRISSFKSTNGGRPKWWDGTGYSGQGWQWAVSAWVPYVGDIANDRFTSVQNVP